MFNMQAFFSEWLIVLNDVSLCHDANGTHGTVGTLLAPKSP